jgi:hypothetical protein
MTAYQTALLHISRHAYKRGAHKGEAPADFDNRKKNHFRMIAAEGKVFVRFHNANIITAYENGDIEFDARGWVDSSTTRAAFSVGLNSLKVYNLSRPYSMEHRSSAHTVVTAEGKTYVYYDGMKFNAAGDLLTVPCRFREYRIDRMETADLTRGLKDSGFKAMFPVIYATCKGDAGLVYYHTQQLRDTLTSADRACDWPDIVAKHKYSKSFSYRMGGASTYETVEKGDAKSCWTSIMHMLKKDMYSTNDTDVTVLNPTAI